MENTKRRRVSAKERKKVFDMFKGHCAYCGAIVTFRGMQLDYMVPLVDGGEDSAENMMPLCRSCKKGTDGVEANKADSDLLKDFYNTNSDFRGYVDRYSKKYVEGRSIPVEEALQHAQVKDVAAYYREKEIEENGIKEP